jgi:subtilase family serine protease
MTSRPRRLVLPLIALVCLAAVTAATAGAAGSGGRQQLAGTQPAWAAAAPRTGTVPDSQVEAIKVWLAPRNAVQLDALAHAVSDPTSSQYRQYLSHADYMSRFAPTAAQVAAVRAWLTGAGLDVTGVGPDGHFLAVSGTASAIAEALGTQLGVYSVNGEQQQAPTSDLSVPSSVAGSVQAVTGLSTLGRTASPHLPPTPGFVNGTPCSDYYGQLKAHDLPKFQNKTLSYAVCGYVPSQLRGVYGIGKKTGTGAGQTVAITDAFDSPTLLQDANQYAGGHGDPVFAGGQFSDHSVPDDPSRVAICGGNGWYSEQTLDVEAVHGMATGANVAYYGAASCYDDDLLAALAQVVSDDQASIVTNSWGGPSVVAIGGTLYRTFDDATLAAYEGVFIQGAVQGIGFYFSSGDSGDELANYGVAQPDFPAVDPWVTAVGGTSLAIGNGNTRKFETGWGTARYGLSPDGSSWVQTTPFLYGAGGGYSLLFAQPWYQDGVVTSNPTGGRAVPDIAMDGDPTTGMLIGQTQTFALPSRYGPAGVHYGEYRVGGTSLSSPLLAGVQAVVQQDAGARIGFANPLLYWLKSQSNGASSFYDPKATGPDAGNVRADFRNGYNADDGMSYTVRTFNQDSSLTTNKAWDDVTGIGTITDRYFTRLGR